MTATIATVSGLAEYDTGQLRNLLVDRSSEAAELAEFIVGVPSRIVVLHGPPDSGKTALVKHWLMPKLAMMSDRSVFYGHCDPTFPVMVDGPGGAAPLVEVLSMRAVVFIDNFERVLDLPRDEKRADLDRLFEERLGDASATIVLVSESRQLNGIYALASYDPHATSAVRQLEGIKVSDALPSLGRVDSERPIEYSEEMLDAAALDCAELGALGWTDTFDLVRLVHAWALAVRQSSGSSAITLDVYESAGRASGILRAHLERRFDLLDAERRGDADIARGIFERLLEAGAAPTMAALSEVGPRLGVVADDVDRVTRALIDCRMLRLKAAGTIRVTPAQLLAVVAEDLAADKREIDQAYRIVADGLREWSHVKSVLAQQRFEEVHAHRRHLRLGDPQARFLLHCALFHERPVTAGAAKYWLQRIGERDDGLNVLLVSMLHDAAAVRMRAASLLAGYTQPVVIERLCVAALSDPDEAVRAHAVDSLAGMKTDEVKQRFLHEIETPGSVYRGTAVDALRIFPGADVTAVLMRQVADPATDWSLRQRTIRVLAALSIPESVDALIQIALGDEDEDDRAVAAQALATTESEELNRHIFARLEEVPRPRVWLAGSLLTVALLVGLMIAMPTLAILGDASEEALGLVMFAALVATVPAGLLIARLREQRLQLKSPLGLLAVLLHAFTAVTILPIVHGLAHLTAKMPRRAVLLIGAELLGFVLWYVVGPIFAVIRWLGWAGLLYKGMAWLLLVGSYVYDAIAVLLGSVVLRRSMTLDKRRDAIYEHVFSNPAAAKLAFDSVAEVSNPSIASARVLLKRFGSRVPATELLTALQEGSSPSQQLAARALKQTKAGEPVERLEELWRTAGARLRRQIVTLLYASPTERSLEVLGRIRPELTRLQKARADVAPLVYRVRIWPLPVRLTILALLPVVGALIYGGIKVVRNPVWPQIVALRQGFQGVHETQTKIEIVGFLSRAYPDKAAAEMLDLFRTQHRQIYDSVQVDSLRSQDSVHAAVAQAVVRMGPRPAIGVSDTVWRRELLRALPRYDSVLTRSKDRSRRALALDVLGTIAATGDQALADTAIRSLARYLSDPKSGAAEDSVLRRRAIASIGALPYDRALPLLDTILRQLRDTVRKLPFASDGDRSTHELQRELERVSLQAFADTSGPDLNASRRTLKATLSRLAETNQTPPITDRLRALDSLLRTDSGRAARTRSCDRNSDNVCDDIDEAIAYIAAHPSAEYGYRDLVNHYAGKGDYQSAARDLERLTRVHGDQVWLHKTLAMIYHENLAPLDASYFAKSYDEMRVLRELDGYRALRDTAPDDYRRIEIDHVEIVLSAQRYRETDSLAAIFLRPDVTDQTYRLNAALFAYMAYVMAGDRPTAEARLTRLEGEIRSLPADFENGWVYPGTEEFIRRSALSDELKTALRNLCKAGPWYDAKTAAGVIAENRRALGTLDRPPSARRE